MSLAKSGQINNVCQANALLTLKEFTLDYGTETTRELGNKIIDESLTSIPNLKAREVTIEKLKNIEDGQRDLRF